MQEQSVLLLADDVSLLAPATEALLGMLSITVHDATDHYAVWSKLQRSALLQSL
jgi:hypothetical protein